MSNHINQIVHEWSYKVDNGMPDVKNPLHLVRLKTTLHEMKYPKKFVETLLSRLREVDEEKYKAIAPGGGAYAKISDLPKDWKMGDNLPTGISKYRKTDSGKFEPIEDDDEPDEKEEPKPEPMKIDAHPFADKEVEKAVDKEAERTADKVDFNKYQEAYNKGVQEKLESEANYMEFEPETDKELFLSVVKKFGNDPNTLTKNDINMFNKFGCD